MIAEIRLAGVSVLDLIAQRNEELDIAADRVVEVPAFRYAFCKLPTLRLAVDAFEQTRIVTPAVTEVDAVASELGVQQVQVGQVHVHHEALEGALLARVIVKSHREARFRTGRTQHRQMTLSPSHGCGLA